MDQSGRTRLYRRISKQTIYPCVLILGIILMILPSSKEKQNTEAVHAETKELPQYMLMQEQLSALLCKMEGAGKVSVLLSIAEGESFEYQTNQTSYGSETVTLTDAGRNQCGLVTQINPPVYLGAVVLCQGADRPAVKLAITQAIANATGLGFNQIAVLKMK